MESVILTPRELIFPEATTLNSQILEAYREKIKSYSERARNSLNIFSDRNGDLAGSNCFAPIILRDLFPKNSRLATMADLGRATEINPNFIYGLFSDTGLTLRTAGDSYQKNDLLAKNLAGQLKKRKITLKHPKVIYFDALDLEESEDSAYGLVYKLNKRAKLGENIIDASELTENFTFRRINERGIPIRDTEGNRTSYTRKEGLSRFYLDGDSDAYSDDWGLAGSGDDGRVVVVNEK